MKKNFIYYNPRLKILARNLRNQSTRSEIILWLKLNNKQCYGYDFHRQKPIGNYILDFFCPKLMLGIELDGITHFDENVYQKDLKKEAYLESVNIKLLRFTDNEVINDLDNVLRAIEGYILDLKDRNHS